MSKVAYLYCHIRKDVNEIFYIGICIKKTRAYEGSNRRNNIWCKITEKTDYDVVILYENLSWAQACEMERAMIKSHGKIYNGTGKLANITDGGDGTIGVIRTNEHLKGKKLSEQHRLKIKNGLLNSKKPRKKYSEEYRKIISDRMSVQKYALGNKLSDNTKLKMSINNGRSGSRKVVDTISKEEYSSLKDLYNKNVHYFEELGLKYSSCVAQLRGQNKNRTKYMYLDLYLQNN